MAWTVKILIIMTVVFGTGCATRVFEQRVTISTRIPERLELERLGEVRAKRCNFHFLIVAVARDPDAAYTELMEKAEARGGDMVIEFEHQTSGSFVFAPLLSWSCWEATGIAARRASMPERSPG